MSNSSVLQTAPRKRRPGADRDVLPSRPRRAVSEDRRPVAPAKDPGTPPPANQAPAASGAALPFVLLGFVWGAVLVLRLLLLSPSGGPPHPTADHAPVVVHPANTVANDEMADQQPEPRR